MMGLEERAQTATHILNPGRGRRRREQDGIGGTRTDGDSHPESREEGDVSKMGLEERARTATHTLKGGRGRRRREQDGIGGTGTDSNSQPESTAGKKAR